MAEFPLTLLWTALGYWGEIFLYDGFSKRRSQAGRFWMISIGYISLNSLLLCTPFIMSSAYAKIPLAITLYTLFHFTQYTVNGGFTLYIAVIYYAITCCTENLFFTTALLLYEVFGVKLSHTDIVLSFVGCILVILICYTL